MYDHAVSLLSLLAQSDKILKIVQAPMKQASQLRSNLDQFRKVESIGNGSRLIGVGLPNELSDKDEARGWMIGQEFSGGFTTSHTKLLVQSNERKRIKSLHLFT
jgi:hypothetical protein